MMAFYVSGTTSAKIQFNVKLYADDMILYLTNKSQRLKAIM